MRSTPDATSNLVTFLQSSHGVTHDIYKPAVNEVVRIGEHVQSYSLTLGNSISASLNGKWSKVRRLPMSGSHCLHPV